MAFGDIRSPDVLGAIALYDDPVEGPKLLDQLHMKPAKFYRLVYVVPPLGLEPRTCGLPADHSGYVVRVLKHRVAQQVLAFPISGPTLPILDVSRSLAMNKR